MCSLRDLCLLSLCVYRCVYIAVCISLCVYRCVYIAVCISLCVYRCVYIAVCISLCVYRCVYIAVLYCPSKISCLFVYLVLCICVYRFCSCFEFLWFQPVSGFLFLSRKSGPCIFIFLCLLVFSILSLCSPSLYLSCRVYCA